MPKQRNSRTDYLTDLVARGLLRAVMLLPYGARVRTMGWLAAHVLAPAAGWRKRIRANLSHVLPDLPRDEVRRLTRAVPDNVGRTLIEVYSGPELAARARVTPLSGPGLPALDAALAAGRPVLVVTAHTGNFAALRPALETRGLKIAALYRPMEIAQFNRHYRDALAGMGEPLFPTTRKGLAGFLKHLRSGGAGFVLTDIHAAGGARLDFFGKPAPSPLSAAKWALQYDALMLPVFSRRLPDGLSFEMRVDAPIAPATPEEMTAEVNRRLEAFVRQDLAQWFWIHRRWKPERHARPDSAAGPATAPAARRAGRDDV
ncbi:lauroyl acyltransferase [Mesobaculum littorinae]|uniref:Lauroyl acyltransferase n=1 Tax=Mesobaculum littorinae TaxID=2486419 RepID=A0A438ALZ7_9RHOB|nr:lysophospholipid acyltransferase family protein [Mesobaculum littorinae]RVV99566.1 lauroyl acyltransferase [Mesobaculum littorinae]